MKKITCFYKMMLLVTVILCCENTNAQTSVTYTPDTPNSPIVVPAGQTLFVLVEAWGAGGKGSTVNSGTVAGGGGGGGAYSRSYLMLTAGSYSINPGSGSTSTSAGGDSSFDSLVIAKGGSSVANNSATGAAGGLASAGTGQTRYSGGTGGTGATGIGGGSGGGGASAGPGASGGNGSIATGGNAPANGGDGGNGRSILLQGQGNGVIGDIPGGGGGGAYRTSGTRTGGAGADGQIVITTFTPEINLTGNGANIISGTTTTSTANWTDFGTQTTAGTGSVTRTFTIQNTAATTQILGLGTITVSGEGSADFTVTQVISTSVNGGSTTTFTIKFDPVNSGTRNAVISIPNNDSDENPYTFAVSGIGTGPEMDVQGNGISIPDGDLITTLADNTNLGSQYITTGILTKTFTIRNTGTSNLNLSGSPRVALTGSAEFSVSAQPTSPVASNGSVTFSISFDPSSAGVKNATVSIINNDDNENPYDFSISGTGSLFTDSDGDGITDEADIDDDNDGIIDTQEEIACKTSPIASSVETVFLNEDFGTGGSRVQINTTYLDATTQYTYANSGDVNDGSYTVYRNSDVASWRNNVWWLGNEDHTPGDTNGRMAIFNAENTAGRIFYTTEFDGITPGIPIKYSFYILNLDRYIASGTYASGARSKPNIVVEFRRVDTNALIAGSTITTGDIPQNTASVNWIQFTNSFVSPVSNIKVIFKNNAPGGLGNDLAIDDILITQTYCDMDSDGDADIFDLDDDNDGIPDIVEGGFKQYSSNKSRMDMSNGALWKDTNANGMNDNIDPEIIGNSAYLAMLVDTDADGIKDFMDLDSDNDSIFDIDEAQVDNFSSTYNGDGDVDGDARGDGVDTDKDGIQDVNDDLNGYGSNFKPYPTDTDGDGSPDYMDITSDGSHYDIYNTIYSDLDANNDGKIDSTTDADKDGVMDSLDGDPAVIGSPRNITTKKLLIDFDGRNDYAEGTNLTSNLSALTMMGWVKVDAAFANAATLFGQDNFTVNISSSRRLFITAKGSGTVSTTATLATELAVNRWYHVAAVYNQSSSTEKLILYINGVSQATSNSSSVNPNLASTSTKFTMAKNPASSTNYFRGFLDEIRVFNIALTPDQLLPMICQEIDVTGGNVYGTTLPKTFSGTTGTTSWTIPWTNLLAYYKLNVYKGDVIDDYKTNTVIDAGSSTSLARIYNVKYLRTQTAPLPFVTYSNSALNTGAATSNLTDFVYGPSTSNPFLGAIINVKHNVTSSGNMTFTGLVVDSGKTITLDNDNKLENSWYVQLNGKIDLQGRSQFIQTANSDLAVTSSGSLERDQQGTKNIYSYNYWSSPVSTINNTTINHGYTVNGVMKDGTTGIVRNLNWTSAFDGIPGTASVAATISRRWIYKFQNLTSSYANWSIVGETGTLSAGQGYTMKGSGTSSTDQNYIFLGKPNNGTINSFVGANNINLSGNPYPSAIDSNQFIYDNIPSTNPLANTGTSGALTGTIYLWEQSTTNNSHNSASYQGGYATISLTGRVKAGGTLAASGGVGDAQKVPGRYIPVGQGFFVEASTAGGQIRFKNSQRAFQRETDSESNTMFRNASMVLSDTDNNPDPVVTDTIKRVRVGFEAHDNYQRQLLLGFMNNYASDAYEPGFDSEVFDDNPVDMYFINGTKSLVIQGVGTFQNTLIYPLGVKTDVTGLVKMRLDGLENIDSDQEIYIYDAITQLYHDIRTEDFVISLDPGTYNERFSLRFTNATLGVENPEIQNQIVVMYTNTDSVLTIFNNDNLDTSIKSTSIFNILGQQMGDWVIEDPTAKKIEIPVKNLATGTYIIKVQTTSGIIAKKVIIK